jgi:hypothetical protein
VAARHEDARRGLSSHRGHSLDTREGGKTMKATLCTECEHCPDVELTSNGVTIGEAGNLAVLTHKEWNLLVDLIHRGELGKVPIPG